jgi:hypothetical protein
MEMISKAMVDGLLEGLKCHEETKEAPCVREAITPPVDRPRVVEGNRKQRRAAAAVARKNARRVTA